mmetsp:Transcript_12054/g.18099  ORF Transcript_12054/g.18099 Transcript_12054/m.18099 type:complete len:541 (+) Transcript_12054:3089-4711(+)|eukprot:CAMPEP_0197306250 /NCGR_PEP_ID=MMETSP0891-20130614/2928_1 /TAXON_ID=44058 ORGANISM="Aureoumbra lagunensis, Strain CCMP1510" /NCGR_SAMPLE_ID=MMETSP0891 /ASSEMBLY_ACC=CAM_ASM_000534 /LENGTH=540 /DNA_ID=CAMNT_0042788253 /DNA_START=3063 /DNA_END=4688 /DNA_ORIENTATION=-
MMLRRALYRVFRRCAQRVDRSLESGSHLRRNAADIVIRSSASVEAIELLKDACRSCSEWGAIRTVRDASTLLVEDEWLDAALSWIPAAEAIAIAAEALNPNRNFLADKERNTQADKAEAAAFRMAAVLGASSEEIVAARRELDRRAFILSQQLDSDDWNLFDAINALADTGCLGNSNADPWARDDDDAYRLDRFLLGDCQAAPIICVVAALAVVSRIPAIPEGALFAVGAPGRFLLGVRGTLLAPCAKEKKDGQNIWFAEFGLHSRELLHFTNIISGEKEQLIATKLTGDPHVPAGEICFQTVDADYKNDAPIGSRFTAKLRVADRGFQKPRWLNAELVLVSNDEMAIIHIPDTPGAPVVPTLFFRRAIPSDPTSVLFLDCLTQKGKIFTRTQLTNSLADQKSNQISRQTNQSDSEGVTEYKHGNARVQVSSSLQTGVVAISVSLDEENDTDLILDPSNQRTPPPLTSAAFSSAAPSLNTSKLKPPSHNDLMPPFPEVDSLEVARRICRNLHNAAQRRDDALASMIATHAGLDFGEPSTS